MSDIVRLAISIALPQAVGLVAAFAGPGGSGGWYAGLAKPSWRPPDWAFGPVWTLLYLLMGIASFLVWRQGLDRNLVRWALVLYLVQLALNFGWSWLFFGLRSPFAGLVDIVLLVAAVGATLWAFARVSSAAGWLLVPYLAWVLFALALNASIWSMNRG